MFRKMTAIILAVLLVCLCGSALAEGGYKSIAPFSEGLAPVQDADGLWGYIDKTGTLVIPCEYENAYAFDGGVAGVRKDRKYGCIDAAGQTVIACEWGGYSPISFSEGLAAVQNAEGLWGFIDTTGTLVLPCEWENVFVPRFSEGLAAVKKDDKTGYINTAGEIVIPCAYKYGNPFSHGYALVQDDEGLFFITPSGEEAFPDFPRAIQGDTFRDDGTAILGFRDKTGVFIDTDGNVLCSISEDYSFRSNFREGLAGIATHDENGDWTGHEGYIDRTGAVVIPLELYSAQSWFRNGRVSVPDSKITMARTERYGVIDQAGNVIYPFTLEKSVEFFDTVAAAVQDGRTGAINTDGEVVVPFEYDDVKVGDGVVLCLAGGEISLFDYNGTKLN